MGFKTRITHGQNSLTRTGRIESVRPYIVYYYDFEENATCKWNLDVRWRFMNKRKKKKKKKLQLNNGKLLKKN